MKPSASEETFKAACEALQSDARLPSMDHFSHEVWSEIALRQERGWRRWLAPSASSGVELPRGVVVGLAALAMGLGAAFGFSRANAYGDAVGLHLEQRYVQSIHPVLMTERTDHEGHTH